MSAPAPRDPDRWPYAIGTLHLLKQQIGILSPDALIGLDPPSQAPELRPADFSVGDLPEDLGEWLAHTDGWPGVWFGMSLSPTAQIVTVDEAPDVQDGCAVAIGHQPPQNLLLVGRSEPGEQLVVVTRADHGDDPAGVTYWVAPDSVDRYDTFYDFFCALVELHRDELADLQPR